jgi:hypothetical protein
LVEQVYKPGSVFDNHLSWPDISEWLQPPARDWRAANMSLCGVAPGGVYIDRQVAMPLVSSYLTFPPLQSGGNSKLRYISVALSLKSPSPGVTRHPCPVEPGLSSDTAFRHCIRDYLTYSMDFYHKPLLQNSQQAVNGTFIYM